MNQLISHVFDSKLINKFACVLYVCLTVYIVCLYNCSQCFPFDLVKINCCDGSRNIIYISVRFVSSSSNILTQFLLHMERYFYKLYKESVKSKICGFKCSFWLLKHTCDMLTYNITTYIFVYKRCNLGSIVYLEEKYIWCTNVVFDYIFVSLQEWKKL